jgi:hypothetical protein
VPNATAPDVTPDGEELWEVEEIVGERTNKGEREYRIRWKGYDEDWDTWEREDGFENMGELLAEWRKTRKGKGRE